MRLLGNVDFPAPDALVVVAASGLNSDFPTRLVMTLKQTSQFMLGFAIVRRDSAISPPIKEREEQTVSEAGQVEQLEQEQEEAS